jgi:fatty-acid desaturase
MITDSFDFDQNGHWKNQKGLQQSSMRWEIKRSVAIKKTPSRVHARDCTKFVASLRLLGWAAARGDGVPPDLA